MAKFNAGKVMPKPFQRKSISVGVNSHRMWLKVTPGEIQPNDVIPELGLVASVNTMKDCFVIIGKSGGELVLTPADRILAFTFPKV